MASLLDVGLFENFATLFAMLFVFVMVYAILQSTKALGEHKGINAIIAFVVAIMLLLAPKVSQTIVLMAPWFVLMFIFIVFTLVIYRLLGADDADIKTAISGNKPTALYWIIIIAVIILIASLGKVYFTGEVDDDRERPVIQLENRTTIQTGDVGGEPGENTFWATLFHPKVLGLIIVMLTGVFAISMLTSPIKIT